MTDHTFLTKAETLKRRIRRLRLSLVIPLVLLFFARSLVAGTVNTNVVWLEGQPNIELTVDAEPIAGLQELQSPLTLFDAQNARLWQTTIKLPITSQRPWQVRVPLEKIQAPNKQHRIELTLRDAALKIEYGVEIYFAAEAAIVQTYGVSHDGVYPARKVAFLLGLNAFRGRDLREIPVTLGIRDAEENVVQNRQTSVPPADQPRQHRLDVTPDTTHAVGPFMLEAGIDSEAHGISFSTTLRFAQPNSLIPISSLEHGNAGIWFAADGQPQRYRTLEYYYSDHLRDLVPRDYPKVSYDTAEKHSGRQSLRIDYQSGREAYVWSRQELPGKPLAFSLWVKGNESNDQLIVHFEDHVNFTLPAWFRNANFEQATVCTLNFAGWRKFSVPALGAGLQSTGTKGSTPNIDGPIKLLALTIRPEPLPKGAMPGAPRSLWIDDLAAESQAGAADLLSMELESSQTDGILSAAGTLAVSVGNGHPTDLKRGKITLAASDFDGKLVYSATTDLPVANGSYAATVLPLKDLAARKPRGPIEVDVTFVDPSVSGARISRRITLKSPWQGGMFQDFEEPVTFNGYQPGKVTAPHAKIVSGGADGSQHALAIEVQPMQDDNSVLLHPALPGEVDHIEMMIQGTGQPVTLQAWFIDSGATGIWIRPYNLFWPKSITVDWTGWRKVTIPAPPIPAHHGEKNRAFLFEPWYPLNLALNAKLETGNQPVEIRIDNLRVVTHLPPEQEFRIQVEFPDETHIHPPGAPLNVDLFNYASSDAHLSLQYKLQNYQGFVAQQGTLELTVPAGMKQQARLLESLLPGIYDLEVSGVGKSPFTACVIVLDTHKYFGDEPLSELSDLLGLRRSLGVITEKIYLDWDNTEPAPYLNHYNWFEQDLKKRRDVPILPKALEGIAVKADAAKAAVVEADKNLKAAQATAVAAGQTEKQAGAKVAASTKALDAPRAAADAAMKKFEQAKAKADTGAAEAVAAQTAQAEALKAAEQLDAAVKAAKDASTAADKKSVEADRLAKEVEAAVKPAEQASITAEKEAKDAEAAAKDTEATQTKLADDPDEEKKAAAAKKATEARAKAADARKKADAARAKAVEAANLAKTKRGEAQALQVLAVAAKKEADSLPAKAQAARTMATKAADQAKSLKSTADRLKGEANQADQALAAAKKKVADLEVVLKADQQTLADKERASRDAIAAIEQAIRTLETSKREAAAASQALEDAKAPYALKVLPVVGFSADWAGPEAAEAIRKGSYARWIPNMLQAPERLVDWSLFVRNIQREYKGRFDRWIFWENPDLEQAPQSLPPERYASLLEVFHRWVKLYNPKAKVVAGGFNFDKALGYLARIPDAHKLPLDEIAVQMNLGELSPEHADMEGFLDDLNDLLRIPETNRTVTITELDWGIGEYLSPMKQAAYHARAAMILDSRGVGPHQFSLINTGFEFDGYGVFYRTPYGNTAELQTFLPYHVPKPSYFAMIETRNFLKDWKYVTAASLPGTSLADNRAFIYRNAMGGLTAALWRAVDGRSLFKLPSQWTGVAARDVFGFEVSLTDGLPCTPLPSLVRMPEGYALKQLLYDLRMLESADDSNPVILDLYLAESDSTRRANYQSTGQTTQTIHAGLIPGGRKVREPFVDGLQSETFRFSLKQPGNVLLRRRWFFDGEGQNLHVRLNEAPEQAWNLTKGQGNDPGIRETTFVLANCQASENLVTLRYNKPGNCAGYRLEPISGDHVPLVRWGAINTRQTKGNIASFTSAVGTPLTIGKTSYTTGIGAHAVSFIEYPLDGQFERFEVTVGIDGSTEGRGSAIFRIYLDDKPVADSGLISGFSKPKTLVVDKLAGARRMILSVMDAGDGNRHDLANWVDGKLYFRKSE